MRINIPQREDIIANSYDDPVLFYYKPFIRRLYLKRLEMALSLMDKTRKDRVIEIGYGSGIFLLELSHRFKDVYAMDVHFNAHFVERMLIKEGVNLKLTTADVMHLPYKAGVFDCIVCISVLEHLNNLNQAIEEIIRIAKPGAQFIFGIPVKNWFMSLSFVLLGFRLDYLHKWNHRQVLKAIGAKLRIERISKFPNLINQNFSLYMAVSCRKRLN